ncbi:MAG: phosphohydrolase, partial [Fusobacterium periodonticum]|nr:phosphohydrolase [Fusobacterium periodonticum]
MLISRVKQVYQYIFSKFDESNNSEIKKILSEEEFLIFSTMSNYDKVHSYSLYQKVKEEKTLSSEKLYLKLALLHDSGKGKVGLFR